MYFLLWDKIFVGFCLLIVEFFLKFLFSDSFFRRKLLSLLEIPPCYFYYYYQTFLHIFSTTKIGLNEPKMTLDIDYKHYLVEVYFPFANILYECTFKVCRLIEFELTNIIVILSSIHYFLKNNYSVCPHLKMLLWNNLQICRNGVNFTIWATGN